MASLNPDHKREAEDGQVPLVQHGALEGIDDMDSVTDIFDAYCQPSLNKLGKPTSGKVGYKSYTFTIPKDLSRMCADNKELARQSFARAIDETLRRTFKNKRIVALSATHSRNDENDDHFNAHCIIPKFCTTNT